MAPKSQQNSKPKKRKQISGNKSSSHGSISKKPKFVDSKSSKSPRLGTVGKPFKPPKQKENQHFKSNVVKAEARKENSVPTTNRDRRVQAKELAEARKKKRKRHYDLEHELARLWEEMRKRDITKEDRSKLISKALENMKGKIPEIAGSHVSSRVLQTCVKHCTDTERDAVFEELKPHFLTLASNTYAVHLVKKMLDNASKKQLAVFISSLRGHVASLLRHMVGSLVVEHAYHLANAAQKQTLLQELYSLELQLFKDMVSVKESRLVDIISKLDIQKASVSRHMTSVIQPILEKGIVDHSIIHRVLMEYFTVADKTSAADVVQQLSSSLLVRMIHTKDGSRIGILCIKHGSAKERKKSIKGMKGHMKKIAHEQHASMVLVCIISVVDDTKLIRKIIISELEKDLKELILDKNGRRVLLQLLHPNCSRYFSPDDLASLNSSIPSLCSKGESGVEKAEEKVENDTGEKESEADGSKVSAEGSEVVEGGKNAVKLGCEKACVFMDKNKMLDKVAQHANTTRAHVLAQLATSVPSFLKSLPEDLLRSLGPTLGIPQDASTVPEMWERIVAMGFCAVLTHLRPRPLKKIAQELGISLNDSVSTEKHCEQIVFTAFPRERLRVKQSRSLKKLPGVCFRVVPNRCRCLGDMGFIDFAVLNVSTMRQDNERHYSPEFEFANLRWSLLCMANKDALALYLCQQGTVHCKFIISIVNSIDADSTVYNEGTQRFSSASAENDWGFNNVVKFDYLLDSKNGFWNADQDVIIISVGIVLVEANAKSATSVIANTPATSAKAAREAAGKRTKAKERIVEAVANQLLETERLENLRKKVKADLQKTQREEEKQRKDFIQRQLKAWQQLWDQHHADKQRIIRDQAERERREQQERAREQERLRQIQEQNDELKRKSLEFTDEVAELNTKKKQITQDVKDGRKKLDSLKQEAKTLDDEYARLQAELAAVESTLAEKNASTAALKNEIEEERSRMPAKRPANTGSENAMQFDADIFRSVRQSIIGLVDD